MNKKKSVSEVLNRTTLPVWDDLPVGILMFEQHGHTDIFTCNYGNQIVKSLIGDEEIIGKSLMELTGMADLKQNDFPEELYCPLSDKWVLLHLSGITDQQCVITVTDITGQKNQIIQLDSKISNLLLSNQDLEHFAYVASHDLHEPLRKIVSFGERLEQKTREILKDEQMLYLNRMISSARRMQVLIDHLLEYSRVTRSHDDFQSVDLNQVFRMVLSNLQIPIAQKNAEIKSDYLPVIEGVEIQLTTLFQNLLSNSLKFTATDTRPQVGISVFEPETEMLLKSGLDPDKTYKGINIADNGIGFEEHQSEAVFTLFNRLRGRSEYEGTGLGLAICKRIIENHQGAIIARGRLDSGAVFTIILPTEQQ